MSCGKPVVDLRARRFGCAKRVAPLPTLHPRPGSWTARLGLTTNPHECTPMTTSSCNKDEVFQIVRRAIEVLNTLGHGIVEKPYENALAVEFRIREIPFRQQPVLMCPIKGTSWLVCS